MNCGKTYGCDGSLNLHIKVKHNGGTKTERDKYARQVMVAKENGLALPTTHLKLFEGFMEYAEKNFSTQALAEKESEENSTLVKISLGHRDLRLQSQPCSLWL